MTPTTHGHAPKAGNSLTYNSWCYMRTRMRNPRRAKAPRYMARLDMDPRWDDFSTFLADVGERPSKLHTLERIDNDRGYWPDNVKWLPAYEQARNRRSNVYVMVCGNRMIVRDALDRLHMSWQNYRNLRWGPKWRLSAQEAIDHLVEKRLRDLLP